MQRSVHGLGSERGNEAARPKPVECCLSQAELADFERIRRFYEHNAHPNLPPPTSKDIGDTIEEGRILIVERTLDRELLACAAIFTLSPRISKTYVGELAGMRTLPPLGGLQPVSAQTLLIGARLLGHAATEPEPAKGRTNSLIAIVKKDNLRSIANLKEARFRVLAHRPRWVKYDEMAWHGAVVEDEWLYYYADDGTVCHAATLLGALGFVNGQVALHRKNRETGKQEQFLIHSELPDIEHATEELKRIAQGDYRVALDTPPEDLVF